MIYFPWRSINTLGWLKINQAEGHPYHHSKIENYLLHIYQ